MDGKALLLLESVDTTLLVVSAESLLVLDCKSWTRQRVVCAHRSNEDTWSSLSDGAGQGMGRSVTIQDETHRLHEYLYLNF
jgi:hypothetical protein